MVGSVWLLAACGGGGGGNERPPTTQVPAPETVAVDYFPLALGNRWTYLDDGIRTHFRVMDSQVVDGAGSRRVRIRVEQVGGQVREDVYARNAAGIYRVPSETADELEKALASVPVLKLPVVAGERYVPLDRTLPDYADLDGDGRRESLSLHVEVTVVGFETIRRLDGEWTGLAHTRTVVRQTVTLSTSNQTIVSTVTSDDFFAPDVGLLRSLRVYSAPVQGKFGSDSELLTWHAGTRRNESTAPVVVSRSPADASMSKAVSIRVQFSEPMDRASGAAAQLTLRNSSGGKIGGSVVWIDDTSFEFQPSDPLGHGRYEATLDPGLEDLAGNKLAETPPWSFTLDTWGPEVVFTFPARYAADVPLDSVLRITFNEDLDPTTVVASNFMLSMTLHASPVPVSATLALEGRTVVLTPTAPLTSSARYELTVSSNIKDVTGNSPTSSQELRFQADTGRFAAPRPLEGNMYGVFPLAMGDFNRDGRTDMVVSSDWLDGVQLRQHRLMLRLQLPDGSFGPPAPIDIPGGCAPVSARAVDLDRDGRPDLVVTAGRCGLIALRQDAAGGFTSYLVSLDSWIPLVLTLPLAADNGLPALITEDRVGLYIRRQDGRGGFGPPLELPLPFRYRGIAVADFDGDGRDDLALLILPLIPGRLGVVVQYQQPDGSFVAGQVTLIPGEDWSLDVGAAGDVTGDGRPDLVLLSTVDKYLGLLPQRPDGGFGPLTRIATFSYGDVEVTDVTGDGRADVLVGRSDSLSLYVQGSQGLEAETLFDGGLCADVWAGDFTGDGLVDIVHCGALLQQRIPPATGANAAQRGSQLQRLRSALESAMR